MLILAASESNEQRRDGEEGKNRAKRERADSEACRRRWPSGTATGSAVRADAAMPPSPICVRCGKDGTGPTNFLLTCSECRRAWHHRCHVPPVEEADLIARVKATMANDVDNGLDGWMCKRCKKNQGKATGGGRAPAPAPAPAASTAQPTASSKDADISHIPRKRPAEPEAAEVQPGPVSAKPAAPAQPLRPQAPAANFQPYERPPHMREASEAISNPSKSAPQPLPRPPTGSSNGLLTKSARNHHPPVQNKATIPQAGPSRRQDTSYVTPGNASTATVPDSQDPRARSSSQTGRPPMQRARDAPPHHTRNVPPPAPPAPPPPPPPPSAAPSIPFASTGLPDFRSISSRMRASGRLDPPAFERALAQVSSSTITGTAPAPANQPQVRTPAPRASSPAPAPEPGPAQAKPEVEDYDIEDLYWPPRAPAGPNTRAITLEPAPAAPEASFPTPMSLSPAPAPHTGKLPSEYIRAKCDTEAEAALVRAWARLRVRDADPDAPRRARKARARKATRREKREREFVMVGDCVLAGA
ncbi:hypothetical protein EVG20_g7980 [Dentipellis fragilis]|uniref:PHD-type domain-containing protein n=1 Tax=Dentipellis fragilis TaxID=205917 RepID=A0A4Y9YDE7_9AGAM|nr:hypothetical protein EVG20_g7980 [Dentipellis fragilis]